MYYIIIDTLNMYFSSFDSEHLRSKKRKDQFKINNFWKYNSTAMFLDFNMWHILPIAVNRFGSICLLSVNVRLP